MSSILVGLLIVAVGAIGLLALVGLVLLLVRTRSEA
ncbi:nitrate reductase gamma subunit [Microlunatus panaciterrae]|uniref:Nitrate reductase gamma subunit n=1 Tax=Microlunatus panaciterrae TaxID=400768 RepID=A0ABS2RH48_9ACTN|nr:nitrate reductase gamma subunit [Microlunatus panaciterrae]